jgi:hypothetical protein
VGSNTNPLEQFEILLNKTTEAIKPLMLHIEQPDYEKKCDYFLQNRIIKKDLVEQLKSDQHIVLHIPPIPDLQLGSNNRKSSNAPWWNPIFIYEYFNHLFPRSILRWIIKTKVKDPQFIGSLKFALGMVLVPLFYLLQTGVCLAISGSWVVSGLYLLSLPVSVLLRD